MKDRIKQIIEYYKLTNSEFSEKIGVAKSGLSHILSGRNKASLDYVIKIMQSFPDINIKWLLTGKQNMLNENKNEFEDIQDEPKAELNIDKPSSESKISDEDLSVYLSKRDKNTTGSEMGITAENSEIQKIIVLYKDSTFKVYKEKY